jgi:hypothetical protein
LQTAGKAPVGKLRRSASVTAPRPTGAQTNEAAARAGRKPQRRERSPERRVNDRRSRRTNVLLDTRSAVGNRRRSARRDADRTAARARAHDAGVAPAGTVLDDDVCA